MIPGDNPAGHGFVLRDLVLTELSGHVPPPVCGEGGGVKNFRKNLCWGRGSEILILVVGGRGRNFELKIKAV